VVAPWFLHTALVRRGRPNFSGFRTWVQRRSALCELQHLLEVEKPDIIHIFGRQRSGAWQLFPASRTIFHEMMTGTVDRHWNAEELAEFRDFAARVARYFAPGEGVAANVRREFGVTREIGPIYTMCPDEAVGEGSGFRVQGSGEEGGGNYQQSTFNVQSSVKKPADQNGSSMNVEHCVLNIGNSVSTLRFGILCRLTGQKGIVYLLEALKQYRDRHGDVDFTFAGIGPMESEIRRFVDSNQLKNVRIVRVHSASEVLSKLDVFVHPSVDDAMPMSIAEALMCHLPCIVCPVGGCADLVRDGREGYVIEPRRPDLILNRMEKFVFMPESELAKFHRNARARYEEVCLPDIVGRVVAEHYRQILRG
jgi:hypothetical protein